MSDAAVLDMKGEPVKPKRKKPRKERETIRCIEDKPRTDWFVQLKRSDGKTWWFLRVSITGLRTRLYGPFATQHRALLFLDRFVSESTFWDGISEVENRLSNYTIPERRFERRDGHYPMIETELYLEEKKGR